MIAMPNINIELPDELHKKLKIAAALKGAKIKELISEALEEATKESS